MDAKYYSGAPGDCPWDEPWPSVEDDPCWSCGAAADEECSDDCDCATCVKDRELRRETA